MCKEQFGANFHNEGQQVLLAACLYLEKQRCPVGYVCIYVAVEPTERQACENWKMKISLPSVINDFYARSKLVFSAF